jgi:phosphoglycerate kinase
LSAALGGKPVAFAPRCIGGDAAAVVDGLEPGGVALLENLRFHPGEEANDPGFAAELAELGDAYVNDAFSTAHRAHASTVAIAGLLPSYAGRAMQAELEALSTALERPAHPVAALVGGAKVSSKLAVLGNLVARVDALMIGGGMANTFLHARGVDIGASLCEKDLAGTVREIEAAAKAAGCEIVLPVDALVAARFEAGAATETVAIDAVAGDRMILDVGPRSVEDLIARLGRCRTLLWNGPLGAFEIPPFDSATVAVAREAGRLTQSGSLVSVAGGGDTVAALNHAGVAGDFTYVSTAGGAFLEWLEGKTLPGVAALDNN